MLEILRATLVIGNTHVLMSEGGQITMPFQQTFWTSGFGTLIDRFGVPWMVNVRHEEPAA